MSAPSRGRGGTTATRGTSSTSRGRATNRGNASSTNRGRGRTKGAANGIATPTNNAGGLLQKLRSGTVQRTSDDGTTNNSRGRGTTTRSQFGASTRARGSSPKTFNQGYTPQSTPLPRTSSPGPPSSHRDFMAQMNEKFQSLKPRRDAERKKAIQDGFLADPEKKTSLANAITPVGTCTDMCPPFERVERIVQNMVDRSEKVSNEMTGRDMPSEDRMVKRFRRSAAGYDEQLPSDIRTPETLSRTLDYLLDKVVGGGERLASIHKFVWDRTRGIRNDFSIQQVSKKEDVRIAVDCYERIARFHILSLHQLSNPNNLQEGEHFDAHQEREQLNNTFLSLMYYYDDNRGAIPLPNEPEFRSYCILFELQALTPDLEDRMQTWPVELLNHPKIQTAFKLYAAGGNTIMDQGPLRPSTPFFVAQSNAGKFWTILSSQAVSYIMACVAEINFSIVRFTALDALWRSAKSAPHGQQIRNQDWTLSELQNYLAFDDDDETLEFCQAFDLAFRNSDGGEQCLDFAAVNANTLDKSSIPSQQIFSHGIVEEKRYRRTLVAVINGVGIAAAIRQGLVVESTSGDDEEQQADASGEDESMFVPEEPVESEREVSSPFASNLNPSAANFTPLSVFGDLSVSKPAQQSSFGQIPRGTLNFGAQKPAFGTGTSTLVSNAQDATPQPSGDGFGTQPTGRSQQQSSASPIFGLGPTPAKPSFPGFGQIPISRPVSSPGSGAADSSSLSKPIFGKTTQQSQPEVSKTSPFGGFGMLQDQSTFSSLSNSSDQNPLEGQGGSPQLSPSSSVFGQNWQKQPHEVKLAESNPNTATFGDRSGFVFKQPEPHEDVSAPRQPAPAPQPTIIPQQATAEPKLQPTFSFAPKVQPSQSSQSPGRNSQSFNPASASPLLGEVKNSARAQPPTFSFTSPPQSEPSTHFPSSLTFEPSTTPQGTPKIPQSGNYTFSSVTELDKSQSSSLSDKSSEPTRQPLTAPTPPSFTPQTSQQSPAPESIKADHQKLVENTSRLILTQPQGLIEYFVSHHVSNLLQTLVKTYLQEQQDKVMTNIRTRHLSRKFFNSWRETTQRNVLTRRAKQRRKLVAAAMKAEKDKKQRNEAELEAILTATRETKKIQEEQRRLKDQADGRRREDSRHKQGLQPSIEASRVAGHKRKIISANISPRSGSGTHRPIFVSHKRSRTIGTMSEPSASMRLSTTSNTFRTSTSSFGPSRLGQSSLDRSTSSTDLRRSLSQKVDSTKTDYFKLKAMGIDPNTPLVPDTAKSLEIRRNKELETKEALLARSRMRPSIFSASATSRASSPAIQPSPRPMSVIVQQSSAHSSQVPTASATSKSQSTEDMFLRQLREAREHLAQDADWFKNQTAVLEKEVEEQEELRQSQSSSRHESPRLSVNGLARANGYEYHPGDAQVGKKLSRTEERIRKTGAHGLATRSIGKDYIPIAMSRQSALRYSSREKHQVASVATKLRGDSNSSFDAEDIVHYEATLSSPHAKPTGENDSFGMGKAKTSTARASLNSITALQNHDLEDEGDNEGEEEEELVEEDEEEQEQELDYHTSDYQPHGHHNGTDGDTEDNNDDDDDLFEEEDDDEEAEEEYDNEDRDQNQYPNQHPLHPAHNYAIVNNTPPEDQVYDDEGEEDDDEDDGTPGTYPQFSRAQSGSASSTGFQSGLGASADDALVLSD